MGEGAFLKLYHTVFVFWDYIRKIPGQAEACVALKAEGYEALIVRRPGKLGAVEPFRYRSDLAAGGRGKRGYGAHKRVLRPAELISFGGVYIVAVNFKNRIAVHQQRQGHRPELEVIFIEEKAILLSSLYQLRIPVDGELVIFPAAEGIGDFYMIKLCEVVGVLHQ